MILGLTPRILLIFILRTVKPFYHSYHKNQPLNSIYQTSHKENSYKANKGLKRLKSRFSPLFPYNIHILSPKTPFLSTFCNNLVKNQSLRNELQPLEI